MYTCAIRLIYSVENSLEIKVSFIYIKIFAITYCFHGLLDLFLNMLKQKFFFFTLFFTSSDSKLFKNFIRFDSIFQFFPLKFLPKELIK